MLKIPKQAFISTAVLTTLLVGFILCPYEVHALSVDTRISEHSTEISSGDRLYFETKIQFPENPSYTDLRIEYLILENDVAIASAVTRRAVGTEEQFNDYIVIPKRAKKGAHTLSVIVGDYTSISANVSTSFNVLRGTDQETVYFYVIIGLIIFVGLLAGVQIAMLKRSASLARLTETV